MMRKARETVNVALPDKWEGAPDNFTLVGVGSSAGEIMRAVSEALREAGNPRSVVDAWRREAMSRGYDHLVYAALVYTGQD